MKFQLRLESLCGRIVPNATAPTPSPDAHEPPSSGSPPTTDGTDTSTVELENQNPPPPPPVPGVPPRPPIQDREEYNQLRDRLKDLLGEADKAWEEVQYYADLVREYQRQLAFFEAELAKELAKPAGERDEKRIDELRNEIKSAQQSIDDYTENMNKEYQKYLEKHNEYHQAYNQVWWYYSALQGQYGNPGVPPPPTFFPPRENPGKKLGVVKADTL